MVINGKTALATIAALISTATVSGAETMNVKAKSGVATTIGYFSSYARDTCRAQAIGDPSIARRPSRGRVEIRRFRGRFTEGLCKGEIAEGLYFIYTSARGYRGADEVSIDIPWNQWVDGPGGVVQTTTYKIVVE